MKNLQFQIVYKKEDKKVIERIWTYCFMEAERIAGTKGETIKVEYIHTSTDLIYLH